MRWPAWVFGMVMVTSLVVAAALTGTIGPEVIATVLFVWGTGAMGLLLVSRMPSHPIGWLLTISATCFAVGGLLVTIIESALAEPGTTTLPIPIFWLGDVAFGLGSGLVGTFVLLLFPDGHLPSPRWRPVAWMAGVGIAATLAGRVFTPELFDGTGVVNPWALPLNSPLLLALEGGGIYLFVASLLASVASLVVRFRRAGPAERRQIEWVAYAVVLLAIGVGSIAVVEIVNGDSEIPDDVENLVTTAGLMLVPVSIGVAVLRYRLYEIGRIVSRTFSWAILTVALVAVYIVSVRLLVAFLPQGSEPAVALSTLLAAALFTPLRRRVQGVVDRRFNRSRYDAEMVVASFGRQLRTATDAGGPDGALVDSVRRTLQPTSVSLWLHDRSRS